MRFLRIFRHVLPRARAWRMTIDKQLKEFFSGLSDTNEDIKDFLDSIWLDIFPQSTRELDSWEEQWGLPNTLVNEQDRRNRLDATWKALGGQDPRYIQDTLQNAGFDVFVHEWWEPGTEPPIGSNSPPATARNPFTYLNDNVTPVGYFSADGAADMQDGDLALAMDGATNSPTGYPLVNKIFVPFVFLIDDGNTQMVDGGPRAQDGGLITFYALKKYVIPADTTKYPYFLYIGGKVFPDHTNVPESRRNEFETLCLKICPNQQWLGILVDYS